MGRRLTTKQLAAVLVAIGAALVIAGVGLVYPPAALVVAGLGLGAVGLEELRSR